MGSVSFVINGDNDIGIEQDSSMLSNIAGIFVTQKCCKRHFVARDRYIRWEDGVDRFGSEPSAFVRPVEE